MKLSGGRFVLLFLLLLLVFSSSFSAIRNLTDPFVTGKWMGAYMVAVPTLLVICANSWFTKKSTDNIFEYINHAASVAMVAVNIVICNYCLLQLLGFLPTNSIFPATAGFDNPAGVIAGLVASFPFAAYLIKDNKQSFIIATLIFCLDITIAALIQSRAGILGLTASFTAYLVLSRHIGITNQSKIISLSIIATISILVVIWLFLHKGGSTSGRTLIWKCSLEMIKETPFFGHGRHGFLQSYMSYQAEYLQGEKNPDVFVLADNVTHPLSEYVRVTVNYGIVGLGILLAIISGVAYVGLHIENRSRDIVLMSLSGICTLSLFSYPFRYPLTLISIVLCVLIFCAHNKTIFRLTSSVMATSGLISLCFCVPLFDAQFKWKNAYDLSSRNATPEQIEKAYMSVGSIMEHNPFFLYNRAISFYSVGLYDSALSSANKSSELMRNYHTELLMGAIYRKKGDADMSAKHYDEASAMCPGKLVPLYDKFMLQKELCDTIGMKETGQKLLDVPVKVYSSKVKQIRFDIKKEMMRLP